MSQWSLLPIVAGVLGSALGVLISNYFPGTKAREWKFVWSPRVGATLGFGLSLILWMVLHPLELGFWAMTFIFFFAAIVVAYGLSWLPPIKSLVDPAKNNTSQKATDEPKPNHMYFKKNWNVRPQFEKEEEGLFVGRKDFLDRLNSHFISKGGGTILVSGVRGVGKTALVDRALVIARRELQNSYWNDVWTYLKATKDWHLIDRKVRRVLLGMTNSSMETADYLTLKQGGELFLKRPLRWWYKFDPVDRRIRRMCEASRWQLFVLKFSASDISGALPEPDQKTTGKPRIDPEKLLRSIIRKLYVTCHPSGSEPEAKVLLWSLNDKIKRDFFNTLEAAYRKSISKSYKEIISNTINNLVKEAQASTLEARISGEKLVILLLCVAACTVFAILGWQRAWNPLELLTRLGVPALIGGYILLTWTYKRTREKSSDESRTFSSSYESDYSLHQMRHDVESILRTLTPKDEGPYNLYGCFRRTAIVFDELDKVEQAAQQLDDVITHFKNFFTLSEAVYVFLTDHSFYEHLMCETRRAQMARHYPPQHTFFTEKIYLRKPDFALFREAFFSFTEPDWIEKRTRSLPVDSTLIEDLLNRDRDEKSTSIVDTLPLETLIPLYVQRDQFKPEQKQAIEREFKARKGDLNPLAQAQIWASQASSVGGISDPQGMRQTFRTVRGWENLEAVTFLYHRRDDFAEVDYKTIVKAFHRFGNPSLSLYEGVDEAPFTLSDLARALCFQTRDHYFDLYNAVYDYIASYKEGAPILPLDQNFAHEPKLWSRYQRLVEIAFDSVKENHPSREYFNALLLESLYRAFDQRGDGEAVAIGDVLFAPHNELTRAESPTKVPQVSNELAVAQVVEGDPGTIQYTLTRLLKLASERLASTEDATVVQQNGSRLQIQPFTDLDTDKINKAIIRLIRLAIYHKAITPLSPNMEVILKDQSRKPSSKADLEFSWNDNCYSVVRSTIREQHENELVEFWKQQQGELNTFDTELGALWASVPIAGESSTVRAAIGELRTRAELVGSGRGTISGPDAKALMANVGTFQSREALWPRIILDRIRAEDDATITEEFDRPRDRAADPSVPQQVSPLVAFETATSLHIRGIIWPRETDHFVYLVVSPVSTTQIDAPTIESVLPDNASLFWYVIGRETPEVNGSNKVRIYISPLASPTGIAANAAGKLITDYGALTSTLRLEGIIPRLQQVEYKDALLAQRAGAEVLGPIGISLGDPATAFVPVAIKSITEMRLRLAATGVPDWSESDPDWKPADAPNRLASQIVRRGNLPIGLIAVIQEAVTQVFAKTNVARLTPDSWIKTFVSATEEPNTISRFVLNAFFGAVIQERLHSKNINDRSLAAAIVEHFVPWLTEAILALAQTRNVALETLLSTPDSISELERQRRNLRFAARNQ